MTDWKQVAAGYGLAIPDAQLERIGPALEDLHAVFRPLLAKIPHDIEPAVSFGFPIEEPE